MNLFECPRLDDAPGYVLGAMPDGEAESYRHHVTECVECAAKVDELDFVSHALLSAVPQLSAPPEIRHRVMAVVRAEAELLAAAGAGADRPPRTEPRRFGWGFARLRPLTAGALAAVLIALGVGTGTLLRAPGEGCTTRATTPIPTGSKSNASGTVTVCDGTSRIAWTGVPPLREGHALVTWKVGADGQPKRVGVLFEASGGKASVDLGKLPGHPKILVTDEADPNTTVPTFPAIAGVAT